jgi:hypothetical protein
MDNDGWVDAPGNNGWVDAPDPMLAYLRERSARFGAVYRLARKADRSVTPFGFMAHMKRAEWILARGRRIGVTSRVRRTTPRRRGAGRPRAQAAHSSARSGDSGDSDPEPAPRPRSARPGARS